MGERRHVTGWLQGPLSWEQGGEVCHLVLVKVVRFEIHSKQGLWLCKLHVLPDIFYFCVCREHTHTHVDIVLGACQANNVILAPGLMARGFRPTGQEQGQEDNL